MRPRCTYVGLAEVDLRQRLGHLRVRVDVVVVQADAAHGAVAPWHAVEAVLLYRQGKRDSDACTGSSGQTEHSHSRRCSTARRGRRRP